MPKPLKLLILSLCCLILAGCGSFYQSQTTVLGLEVAYDPLQSAIPTLRLGVTTHRQNIAARDTMVKMRNEIAMYDINLWSTSGTLHGSMVIE